MDPAALDTALKLIDTIGTLGILLWLVFAFARGYLIPRSTLEQILKSADERTVKLANELKEGFEMAVKHAVSEAITESRRGNL